MLSITGCNESARKLLPGRCRPVNTDRLGESLRM
jgi:hypothetical protein